MVSNAPVWRYTAAAATLVAGAWCTWASLRLDPADRSFVPMASLLALVWIVGAFATGGMPSLLKADSRWRFAVVIGIALCVASLLGGAVLGAVPVIGDIVSDVLAHSNSGSLLTIALVTACAGIGEELFFRGALFSLMKRNPIAVTTAIYAIVTAASGNVMLVGAAVLVGGVTAYQRHLTGGVAVSVATHVTWAMAMLFALPHLLG